MPEPEDFIDIGAINTQAALTAAREKIAHIRKLLLQPLRIETWHEVALLVRQVDARLEEAEKCIDPNPSIADFLREDSEP